MVAPLSSTTKHSRVGTSDRGWRRTVLTRPVMIARVRHSKAEIGVVQGDIGKAGIPSEGIGVDVGALIRGCPLADNHLTLILDSRSNRERDDRRIYVGELAYDRNDVIRRLIVEDPAPGRRPCERRGRSMLTSVSPSANSAASSNEALSQSAVRAVDDIEGKPGEPYLLPAFTEPLRQLVVDVEVNCPDLVGHQGTCVLNGSRRS